MSKRWKALFLAAVPGLGHFYLRRHWRGVLVFAIFALAANCAYFVVAADDEEADGLVLRLFVGAAAAAWSYSVLHVARLSGGFETRPVAERKDYRLRRGLARYLAGSFESARDDFAAVLKLDPMDVDARFHLAMTHKQLGQRTKAVRAFKRCLADDIDAKWAWEVKTELEKLGRRG